MRDPGPSATLEHIPLRLAFSHEAQSFTRWLAGNLHRLSSAIETPLRLIDARAVGGGRFADLLARDERDGSLVVIENQLEAADDAHLGQILTYLAAADARTVVWIAERFAGSHLTAVRWLNEIAPLNCFAVRVRAVSIGGSALAAVFEALEKPAQWRRAPAASANPADAGRLDGFARGFWAAHLARHPEEAALSRAVGERCRWRATEPRGVVIGQLVEENAASVFLRGRRGVPLQTVVETLAPFADRLERRLGVPLHRGHATLFAAKSKPIDVTNPAHWEGASDFLVAEAQSYDTALRELPWGGGV